MSVTKDEISPDVLRQVADELGHYVYALVDLAMGFPFTSEKEQGTASRLTAEKLCGHITVVILRLRQTNRAFQAKSVRSANLLAISTSGLFVRG